MPPSRRTQQERRERAEQALISAAAEIVVESGVRSLTLAAVGQRAGYSRGVVTHHFGAKQGLVDALARAAQRGFVPGVENSPPGLDRLLRLVEGYPTSLGHADVRSRAFFVLWVESISTPELARVFRERDARFRADLAADVEAGLAAGHVRLDADPWLVATSVVGQLRGIALQYLVDPGSVDLPGLSQALAMQWRAALEAPSGPVLPSARR